MCDVYDVQCVYMCECVCTLLLCWFSGHPRNSLLSVDVFKHILPRTRIGGHLAPALREIVNRLFAGLQCCCILLAQLFGYLLYGGVMGIQCLLVCVHIDAHILFNSPQTWPQEEQGLLKRDRG